MSAVRLAILLLLTGHSVIAAVAVNTAAAYDIDSGGMKWPGATTILYTGIPAVSPSGIPWAEAYRSAANEWSSLTRFNFELLPQYRNPCEKSDKRSGGYFNGADFRSDVCGSVLSDSTVAVTVFYYEYNMFGAKDLVEADIIFNENLDFDVYNGPLMAAGARDVYDFRRVALHELGHALGLNHENSQRAIMAPTIGRIDRLQPDDIDGANLLYGGLDNCETVPLAFGSNNGALDNGDCRIQQLMVGGSDDSFVDVYSFELEQKMDIEFMLGVKGDLGSVLILADGDLNILEIDDGMAGECNPLLHRSMDPGRYLVLVNTYSGDTELPCGTERQGAYDLSVTIQASTMPALNGYSSLSGAIADVSFSGGVTTDGGATFVNRVFADSAFTVQANVIPDPGHVGQTGFVAAAVLMGNGEWLVKDIAGDFVPYKPWVELVPIAARGVIPEQIDITLIEHFVAESIGLTDTEVSFFVGYGLDSNPNELYINDQPINLQVVPRSESH